MKNIGLAAALILALMLATGCQKRSEGNMVDLVLVNGKVWTGEAARPWAEAVAVRDGLIFAVGQAAELRTLTPSGAKLVDLGGSLVLPGFIDSHTHFLKGGAALERLRTMKEKHPSIGDVRGLGLMIGVEFVKEDGSPDKERLDGIMKKCLEKGLIIIECGVEKNVARIMPPLTVTEQEMKKALDILEEALV